MSPLINLTLSVKGKVLAEIPGPSGTVHSLLIAEGEKGMAQLYRLLVAQRERGRETIGLQAAPTQKMLDNLDDPRWDGKIKLLAPKDKILRDAQKRRDEEAAEAITLEELGL